MTEEQTKPIEEVEEKEEKRKIRIVSQIDDRLAIQGQAYMRGDLKEALSLAYDIIDIAKQENLNSFIKEQEEFIAKIKGLVEESQEKKRAKLRSEQLKLRLERSNKLKNELKQLEDELNNALNAEDYKKSSEIYEKAKTILSKIDDDEIKKNWEEFKKKISGDNIQKKLMEKAEKVILEVSKLKEKFQFKDLKDMLISLIEEFNENGITNHLGEIKRVQTDILEAEKDYTIKLQKLDTLTDQVKLYQKEKKFNIAIPKCENLINIAKSVKRNEVVDEFSNVLINLQNHLELEELQNLLRKLNEEGLGLLRKGDLSSSLEKFKEIQNSLKNYIG